jgi:hypothetical protein
VTGFFRKGDGLEGKLRAARPQPSDQLVNRIEARVSESSPRYNRRSFRYAVPAALTIVMVSALAAVGGVSYAASGVAGAVHSVAKVFSPAKGHGTLTIASQTAGGDQYRPGYGWGDDNHNHTGPPGLKKKGGGEFAPPLTPKIEGNTATISTSFTIDEQARLFISVIDTKSKKPLLVTQSKSKVGGGVKGKPAKNIDYQVLVPRTIPLKLALPANLVLPGHSYAIQVIARDPDGNKKKLLIPFKG